MSVMVGPSLPPCRDEGVPVHQDPVHGIVTNPGNREWEPFPLSFFVVWDNPVHRVLVNWDPTISQVIDLLGGIQKGNASITVSYTPCALWYPVPVVLLCTVEIPQPATVAGSPGRPRAGESNARAKRC